MNSQLQLLLRRKSFTSGPIKHFALSLIQSFGVPQRLMCLRRLNVRHADDVSGTKSSDTALELAHV